MSDLRDAHTYELKAAAYLSRAKYWQQYKDRQDSDVHIRWYLKTAEFFKEKAKEIRENELKQVS